MSWLRKLFTDQREVVKPTSTVKSEFSIEYYPETGRYYPKHGIMYLKRNYNTGIVDDYDPRYFIYASYGSTEKEALDYIKLYKEQQLKENVKTISVNL